MSVNNLNFQKSVHANCSISHRKQHASPISLAVKVIGLGLLWLPALMAQPLNQRKIEVVVQQPSNIPDSGVFTSNYCQIKADFEHPLLIVERRPAAPPTLDVPPAHEIEVSFSETPGIVLGDIYSNSTTATWYKNFLPFHFPQNPKDPAFTLANGDPIPFHEGDFLTPVDLKDFDINSLRVSPSYEKLQLPSYLLREMRENQLDLRYGDKTLRLNFKGIDVSEYLKIVETHYLYQCGFSYSQAPVPLGMSLFKFPQYLPPSQVKEQLDQFGKAAVTTNQLPDCRQFSACPPNGIQFDQIMNFWMNSVAHERKDYRCDIETGTYKPAQPNDFCPNEANDKNTRVVSFTTGFPPKHTAVFFEAATSSNIHVSIIGDKTVLGFWHQSNKLPFQIVVLQYLNKKMGDLSGQTCLLKRNIKNPKEGVMIPIYFEPKNQSK
jgi:hypothetical protein